MQNEVKIKEVLLFLREWKTRADVREQYKLSNTQSWHLIKWLKKAHLIQTRESVINGSTCEEHKALKEALKEEM